jgi:hypothetical protein
MMTMKVLGLKSAFLQQVKAETVGEVHIDQGVVKGKGMEGVAGFFHRGSLGDRRLLILQVPGQPLAQQGLVLDHKDFRTAQADFSAHG